MNEAQKERLLRVFEGLTEDARRFWLNCAEEEYAALQLKRRPALHLVPSIQVSKAHAGLRRKP